MKIMENSPYAAIIRYPFVIDKKAEIFEPGVKSVKHGVTCLKKDKTVAVDFKNRCSMMNQ